MRGKIPKGRRIGMPGAEVPDISRIQTLMSSERTAGKSREASPSRRADAEITTTENLQFGAGVRIDFAIQANFLKGGCCPLHDNLPESRHLLPQSFLKFKPPLLPNQGTIL